MFTPAKSWEAAERSIPTPPVLDKLVTAAAVEALRGKAVDAAGDLGVRAERLANAKTYHRGLYRTLVGAIERGKRIVAESDAVGLLPADSLPLYPRDEDEAAMWAVVGLVVHDLISPYAAAKRIGWGRKKFESRRRGNPVALHRACLAHGLWWAPGKQIAERTKGPMGESRVLAPESLLAQARIRRAIQFVTMGLADGYAAEKAGLYPANVSALARVLRPCPKCGGKVTWIGTSMRSGLGGLYGKLKCGNKACGQTGESPEERGQTGESPWTGGSHWPHYVCFLADYWQCQLDIDEGTYLSSHVVDCETGKILTRLPKGRGPRSRARLKEEARKSKDPDWHLARHVRGVIHRANESPPDAFAWGPITGSKRQLGSFLGGRGEHARRNLDKAIRRGAVWCKKLSRQRYELWFDSAKGFAIVDRCRQSLSPSEAH